MNNLGIKSENILDVIDLTDADLFLDVKKEETENDCIFIEDEDELLEVIPVKTENCTKGNFETIFLPEVYTGVAVETPFFDIISYKKKYGHTEDYINNKSDMHMNSNPNENSVHQNIKQEEDQVGNQKEAFGYYTLAPPCLGGGLNGIPMDSFVENSRLEGDEQIQHKEECETSSSYSTEHYNWTRCKRKISDEGLGKYKCPVCKHTKSFDTLIAVNNHLKFDHVLLFSIRKK